MDLKDRPFRRRTGRPALSINELFLVQTMPGFNTGIVPTVAFPTHARGHVRCHQTLAITLGRNTSLPVWSDGAPPREADTGQPPDQTLESRFVNLT